MQTGAIQPDWMQNNLLAVQLQLSLLSLDTIVRGTLGFAVLRSWPFFASVFRNFRF